MEEKHANFDDFGLSTKMMEAVGAMGFEEPTPIQSLAIPVLLRGRDLIGQAQTGTGKTAAFGIPIIEQIDLGAEGVQAIILAPTRELAVQAAEEMNKLGTPSGIHSLPVYGGTSIERQIKALKKGVHVVVGTPGRILDHLQRRTLNLKSIKVLVLDEADEMLDMGFIDDIRKIIRHTPNSRQTMLFSATMPQAIRDIASNYMTEPETVKVAADTLTAPKIDQIFYEVSFDRKFSALTKLIDLDDGGRFLVFCHTKREADQVAGSLKLRGYEAEAMHGDFSQAQREDVLGRFRSSDLNILIATDVAARGLDITGISHVVNYSIPQDPESYVHRIGRTGRAGSEGLAITFVTPREIMQLRLIEKISRAKITKGKLPVKSDILLGRLTDFKAEVKSAVEGGGFKVYQNLAEKFADGLELKDALAAMLKLHIESDKGAEAPAKAKEAVPEEERRRGGAEGGEGAEQEVPHETARLFVSIGSKHDVDEASIVSTISERADIPPEEIKGVDIFDNFTYVNVPKESAEQVIELVHQSLISDRKVEVSPAKPRTKGGGRSKGGRRPGKRKSG